MSSAIARQPVRHQPVRFASLSFQQLAKEAFGCSPISSRLHEDVDHVAVLVDGAPQVLKLALDGDEDLVEIPDVTESAPLTPQAAGILAAKLPAPLPDRLVRDSNSTFGEQVLHVSQAQGKAVVQPDGATDDLGREPMAAVTDCSRGHEPSLPSVAIS